MSDPNLSGPNFTTGVGVLRLRLKFAIERAVDLYALADETDIIAALNTLLDTSLSEAADVLTLTRSQCVRGYALVTGTDWSA